MLSSAARTATIRAVLARTTLPRVAFAATTTRSFGLGDELYKKEKVEEDRYMRELEKTFFENKKKEMAAKMNAEHEKQYKEVIAPAMAEIEVALKKSGDKISHAGLETIARWKLGIKE